MSSLFFDSSTNIKDLLGRKLVTNKISAIFELVKNSFDADAETVTVTFQEKDDSLVIEDDGEGMNLDDIRNKWMVIGTDNKKGLEVTKSGRPLNGEKGIGRFSADRLGSQLTLIASRGQQQKPIKMVFDWEKFENQNNKKLGQIPIDYSYLIKTRKSGVKLIISGLRDVWTKAEVENLEKKLRGLLSPFSDLENNKFNIILNCTKFGYEKKILEPHSLSDISSLWVKIEIPIQAPDTIKYVLYRNGMAVDEKTYTHEYKFGPTKCVIYSFDKGDKLSFKSRMAENVKDFGNVRIYRDFFQVYPYGETNNDWLDLEVRKTQGLFRHLGARDLIGYVQIYRKHNPLLADATNRQGLEENRALDQLREFIRREPIPLLEEWFYFKKHKTAEKEHLKHREEISDATKNLVSLARELKVAMPEKAEAILAYTKTIQATNQKQDKIIRDQQQLVEVYKRIASKETLLHSITHQALIRVQNIETAIWNQRYRMQNLSASEEIKEALAESQDFIGRTAEEINKYLISARDYLLKKREKVTINLFTQINSIFEGQKYSLEQNEIEYVIDGPRQVNIKIDVNDFKVILDNLISNSIKSLIKVTDRRRVITFKYSVDGDKLNVIFKDNGIGIEKKAIAHIFTPFYTTTSGFGMGLAIVDELIKSNNGDISLIIPNEHDVGASFQITIKLE